MLGKGRRKARSKDVARVSHDIRIERDLNWQLNAQENPDDSFFVIKNIHSGTYGSTCQIVHTPSMRLFAGKQISKKNLDVYQELELDNLVDKIKTIISTYTTRVYGMVKMKERNVVLMEYCDRGSLREYLDANKRVLSEDQIAVVMRDIIRGLLVIHKKYNLVHGDIKASNILLTAGGFIKLTDTSMNKIFQNAIACMPFWSSPELLSESKVTTASDVWSLGTTAVELSEGAPPFVEWPLTNAISKITTKGFPGFRDSNHSPEFIDFVTKCTDMNPDHRPTIAQLMEHEFIRKGESLPRKAVLYDLLIPRQSTYPPTKLYENIPVQQEMHSFARSPSTPHIGNNDDDIIIPMPRFISHSNPRSHRTFDYNELKYNDDQLQSPQKQIFFSAEEQIPLYPPSPPPALESNEPTEYILKSREMASKVSFVPFEITRYPPDKDIYNIVEDDDEDVFEFRSFVKSKTAPKKTAWVFIVIAVYLGGMTGLSFLIVFSLVVFFLSAILLPNMFPFQEE